MYGFSLSEFAVFFCAPRTLAGYGMSLASNIMEACCKQHRNIFARLLLLLCFVLPVQNCLALDTAVLPSSGRIALESGVSSYTSHDSDENIEAIGDHPERFTSVAQLPLGVAVQSPVWLRFSLSNSSTKDVERILAVGSRHSQRVRLWVLRDGEWLERGTIDTRNWHIYPSAPSPYPYFHLTLAPGESEYMLAIEHQIFGPVRLSVWEPKKYWKRVSDDNSLMAFFIALCLAMALYNLALFVSMRETMYLYYAGNIFFGTLFFPLRDLYFSAWVGLDLRGILIGGGTSIVTHMTMVISMIMLALYAFRFLGIAFISLWQRWIRVAILACPIFFWVNELSQLIRPRTVEVGQQILTIGNITVLCYTALLIGLVAHSALAGSDRARGRWLLVSLGIAQCGTVLEVLRLMGYLSDSFRFSVETGVAIEIMILTLFMTHRINQLRRDKLSAQQALYEERKQEAARLEEVVVERTQQLDQKVKELARSNATKDTFFSIIAHDLRGPVGNLHMVLKLARDGQIELDNVTLHELTEGSGNTFNLLEELLAWARSQRGQLVLNPENFHLSTVIQDSVPVLLDQAKKKGVILQVDVCDDLYGYGDVSTISTVVRNLLSNAIKFTPAGGRVTLYGGTKDEQLLLSIRDTGVGMSHEQAAKLFNLEESNVSTPGTNSEGGTGLGLILCKEFVEKNGGVIDFKSMTGHGTEFWFTLPCGKPPRDHRADINDVQEASWQGVSTLLVEDNRINLEAHRRVLAGMGISPVIATTGTEAVAAAAEHQVQLVLMDIDLPEMNGLDATCVIRRIVKNRCYIVALTSYTEKELREMGGNIFDGHLEKPLQTNKLENLLDKFVLRNCVGNEQELMRSE